MRRSFVFVKIDISAGLTNSQLLVKFLTIIERYNIEQIYF